MAKKAYGKGRSQQTYKNKLRKMKTFYRLTFKHSTEQKERTMTLPGNNKPQKEYFCDKYPTEVSFFKVFKIKECNISK